MPASSLPRTYTRFTVHHPQLAQAINELGNAAQQEGPIDRKTAHLIQLAAAVGNRSEGAVHSHSRRALEAGASREEIEHAVLLLTNTLGFPTVMAALSWTEDVTGE